MTSMPGSATAPPLQGHVKLVPSSRNAFSLTPEPRADTVLLVPFPTLVGETPGATFDEIEQAEPASRNVPDVVGAEARLDAAASGLDARAPRDFDGHGYAGDRQYDDTFDCRRLRPRRSSVIAIRGKAVHPYFQRVEPGRKGLKSQLPFFVGHRVGRSADESRRGEGDLRAGKGAALFVFHGADQSAGEPLGQSGSRHAADMR